MITKTQLSQARLHCRPEAFGDRLKRITNFRGVMDILDSFKQDVVLEELLGVAAEVFPEKHKPFGTELQQFHRQQRVPRNVGPLTDEQRSILRNYALAAFESFRETHPHLGKSDEIHALSWRYVKHYGSSTGLEHVDLLMYLRLATVFCLKTNEPYTVKFQAFESPDTIELTVQEGDVYTLNEARANDCSHQIASTNQQDDAKISLIFGYFRKTLKPLVFSDQKLKWPEQLHWTKTNRGIWPTKPRVWEVIDLSGPESTEDTASKPQAVTGRGPGGICSTQELAFAMRVVTGRKIVPQSFKAVCGLH